MTTLGDIYDLLFGCQHEHISKPITRRMTPLGPKRTYVVCLDCGHEVDYDLERMCIVEKHQKGRAA